MEGKDDKAPLFDDVGDVDGMGWALGTCDRWERQSGLSFDVREIWLTATCLGESVSGYGRLF